jgi:small GTP-binding protein
MTSSSHLTFKIIVVGNENVGKTTILHHYTLMPVFSNSGSTIGIDFQSRMVALSADPVDHHPHSIVDAIGIVDNAEATAVAAAAAQSPRVKNYDYVKCCFWDTSGSPSYQSIALSYYKSIAAAIVVFDLSNEKTYADLYSYIYRILQKNICAHKHPILVIGNKLDKRALKKTRVQIQHELCTDFPGEFIKYVEVSCLDKVYVDDKIMSNNATATATTTATATYNSYNVFQQHRNEQRHDQKTTVVYNCATCAKSSDLHSAITSFLQFIYDSMVKPHYHSSNPIADIRCTGINGISKYFKPMAMGGGMGGNSSIGDSKNDSIFDPSCPLIKTPRNCCHEHYYTSSSSSNSNNKHSGCHCSIL